MLNSPLRSIDAEALLYDNSNALIDTFTKNDGIKEFKIERVGEKKFLGFGICQKLDIKLVDKERELNITTENIFDINFVNSEDYVYPFPLFYVTEVNRDENTNELSITAYDVLNSAAEYKSAEVILEAPYTLAQYAEAVAAVLGLSIEIDEEAASAFQISYESGANLDGTENLREVLDDIAEASFTIYFVNSDNSLVFKRLDKNGLIDFTIDKSKYFSLDSQTYKRLSAISHVTELGDNLTVSADESGVTQYFRDNSFLEMREDVSDILDAAIIAVGGLTINQFSCSWRGNYLLEIGDKIYLETKDGEVVTSFVLDDVITYNGALAQTTQWSYEDNEKETDSNPTSIGDALKLTKARVDKANQQIELIAQTAEEQFSQLLIDTEGIKGRVESLESSVETAVTAEGVELAISTALESGIDSVTTTTGFTFDENGLTVSKTDSEMETAITEDGMTVSKNGEEVLVANNEGVNAENLHATTYLIIGSYSRLENYGERTGCFWIGG